MNLQDMTGSELIEVYNSLGPAQPITSKKWFKAKSILIDKIMAQGYGAVDDTEDEGYELINSDMTIKEASLTLLCHVDHFVDKKTGERQDEPGENTRTVGLTYTAILDEILDVFEDAETTLECLRWYAVKVRVSEKSYEGYVLPQVRPRSRRKQS